MKCPCCGKPLPSTAAGKRSQEDGNHMQKRVDDKRRHPVDQKASMPLKQLQEARLRIRVLERIMRQSGLTLPIHRKKADPVLLWAFVAKHNVARTPVQGVIDQRMLRPMVAEDASLMLDAEGQCSFWQLFHDVGPWQTCPDCPHYEDFLFE